MARHRTGQSIGCVLRGACVVAILLVTGSASGEVDQEPVRPVMNMGRKQCITEALRNNLDIKISQIGPLTAEANVMQAWGAYDPLLTGNISASANKSAPSPFDIQQLFFGSRTEGIQGQLGVGGNLPTGTAYDLTYDSFRRRFYSKETVFVDHDGDPSTEPVLRFERHSSTAEYDGNIALRLTQSLLRARGLDVNMTQIRVAAKNRNVSELDLMRVVMQTVSAVQSAYWELVFARANLEVKKKSLAVAMDLLDRNRRSHAIGTLARFLVDQAEAGVALREAEIIAARTTVRDAEDLLKQVMNMPDDDRYWTAEIVPADQAEVVERAIDLDEEIRLACELRPEILQARKNIEITEMNERYARNQMLPQLDMFGSYGFNSAELSYNRELEYLARGDYWSYSYGLSGSIPIGNRVARAQRISAKHSVKQAKLQLRLLEHNIGVEVRQAARSVATNLRLIDANRATRELREKTLQDERTRFEVGVSTSYQLLEKEEDLAEALSSELRAIVDYRKAMVVLDLADGTILTRNDVEFVAEDE